MKEFSTSSLKGEVAAESGEHSSGLGIVQKYEIHEGRKWHRWYVNFKFQLLCI